MADPVIRLDKTKTYSENRGEMTPDDPMYRVAYWQGSKMGGKMILLPFDCNGDLVPDDGATAPKQGINSEGKPTTYHPLWSPIMRQYVEAKKKRAAAARADEPDPFALEEDNKDEDLLGGDYADEVNFEAWLRGETRYTPTMLRTAAQRRFSRKYQRVVPDLIVDLVRDDHLVPEDQLCDSFRVILKNVDKALAAGDSAPPAAA